MKKDLKQHRMAVRQAMKQAWAQGVPVYQARSGFMIAIYPDGHEVKLMKLTGLFYEDRHGATKALASRRTKRRG